ncbi:tetratricopeptide repeat protein [Kitasatospora sp. NPDC098663]|uniref:tetratricopeptide repeat protein n=1 Tax=Kitasatospora sp. NPDC098663 TaxID=3364096 RepID=UPI003829A8E4
MLSRSPPTGVCTRSGSRGHPTSEVAAVARGVTGPLVRAVIAAGAGDGLPGPAPAEQRGLGGEVRQQQAQHLHDLGACAQETQGHQLARIYLTEALRRRTELGSRRDTGVSRVALAVTCHHLGDSDTALGHLSTAHRELTATGDGLNAGRARAWQGRIHASRDEHAQAATALARHTSCCSCG